MEQANIGKCRTFPSKGKAYSTFPLFNSVDAASFEHKRNGENAQSYTRSTKPMTVNPPLKKNIQGQRLQVYVIVNEDNKQRQYNINTR